VRHASFDNADELGRLGGRQQRGQPGRANELLPLGIEDADGGIALTIGQELLHRRRHEQGEVVRLGRGAEQRFGAARARCAAVGDARDHHRIGQHGHQTLQALVLLQRGLW